MAQATVNLFWFGNTDKLPTGSKQNVSRANAQKLVGETAEGKDQLKAIEVTGNNVQGTGSNTSFKTVYDRGSNPSEMTYASPQSGEQIEVNIQSFMSATFELNVINTAGQNVVVQQTGVIIHMSNGDMFFRPSVESLSKWSDINKLIGMKVLAVQPESRGVATIGFNADIFEVPVVCFASGTLIRTDRGDIAVEALQAGDRILTKDNGFLPLGWIGGRALDAGFFARNPNTRPIRIARGALGGGLPEADLLVSPQHRILLVSEHAQRHFGTKEVLVAAKHLTMLEGVSVAEDVVQTGYFHLMFEDHQIVFANGAEAESLYAGTEAMKALTPAAREEIAAVFPELSARMVAGVAPARLFLNGAQGKKLAGLHAAATLPAAS